MFYHLLYPLRDLVSAFNIFRYITFRSAYAAVTALLISFLLGPLFIRMLKRRQLTEGVREYVPESHAVKAGTPTMGGLLILTATLVPTLLWARLDNDFVWLMIFATVWLGAVGFADDYLKVVKRRKKGLVARYKLAGQLGRGERVLDVGTGGSTLSNSGSTGPMIRRNSLNKSAGPSVARWLEDTHNTDKGKFYEGRQN